MNGNSSCELEMINESMNMKVCGIKSRVGKEVCRVLRIRQNSLPMQHCVLIQCTVLGVKSFGVCDVNDRTLCPCNIVVLTWYTTFTLMFFPCRFNSSIEAKSILIFP